jgi:putative acyl-CoA dehydrogenase
VGDHWSSRSTELRHVRRHARRLQPATAFDGAWARDALGAYGALAGGELAEHGRLANRHGPELHCYDRYGHRIDLLRAMQRSPSAVDALMSELERAKGSSRTFDEACSALGDRLREGDVAPFEARIVAERMAVLLQASLLTRHASERVASTFVRARLAPRALAYGGLDDAAAVDELLGTIGFDLP